MGITNIGSFNRHFNTTLPDDDYDTIGGWLAEQLGHIRAAATASAITT